MDRRDFLRATAAAGIARTAPASGESGASRTKAKQGACRVLPEELGEVRLEQLRDDYRDRLFNRYLPFWEKGGYDKQLGGFMCELNDDGSVHDDTKFIWYQGRGIWVYCHLYCNFGQDPHYLEIAKKTRDFMLKHMYAGKGRWYQQVRRDGSIIEGVSKNIYGWFFAAAGLAELYRAAGDKRDLDLAIESIWAAATAYDDPGYMGVDTGHADVKIPEKVLRTQGHSMVIVWVLCQLLMYHRDRELEHLQREHVDVIMNRFWNAEYGIANEFLLHDYRRIAGYEGHMFAGHTLETLWMVMHEAVRVKDLVLFNTAKDRFRHVLEMCWDYVFGGWASTDLYVFDTGKGQLGPNYNVKTMWAQTEILIGCMTALEYTGETWAKEWYQRARAFILERIADTGHGVWRQAVDRRGNNLKRKDYSAKRKGNFHQPRCLMMNLLSLERMIKNKRNLTRFGV